jgi:hypothetical protein
MLADPDFKRRLSGKPTAEEVALQKEVAEEVKKSREADKENVEDVTVQTPTEAQVQKAPQENMTVVPEGTDEMSQKHQQTQSEAGVVDVANAGAATQLLTGPGGGATESQTSMTLQVQGQINIMMNTQLFRAEMATLVAEAVSTPEVRGALSKQGFLNTKSN